MKKLYFFSFIVLFSTIIIAQNNRIGFNLKAYQPISAFDQNTNSVPIGLSFIFLQQQESSRFSYGFESGFSGYGCEEKTIQHKGQDVEIYEDDAFFSLHGVIRYDLMSFKWSQFYGEGKAGMNTFFTTKTAKYNDDCESAYQGDLKVHGSSFNVSLGGGVLINPTIFGNFNEESTWLIDLGAGSTIGSSSSYGIPNEEQQGFNQTKSFTNFIDYRIGVIINL